ncbi:hypothetical protein WN48_00862 [Eufriesea mexicana]|nr:hypothetical protein WN48_00862 [Eufriesea mexicana]
MSGRSSITDFDSSHRGCSELQRERGERRNGVEKGKRERGTKAEQRCSRGGTAKSQRFQESISVNRIVHAPRTERNTTTAGLPAISNDVSFDILCARPVA